MKIIDAQHVGNRIQQCAPRMKSIATNLTNIGRGWTQILLSQNHPPLAAKEWTALCEPV